MSKEELPADKIVAMTDFRSYALSWGDRFCARRFALRKIIARRCCNFSRNKIEVGTRLKGASDRPHCLNGCLTGTLSNI